MGKLRAKKLENAGTEDILADEIGRKIVSTIIDDEKHGRFKVLLREHSKAAVATYKEKDTTLSLLQIASIAGNVHAAEVLLGLGADKSITWDYSQKPGGWHRTELDWLQDRAVKVLSAKSENICELDPPSRMQPLVGAKLSILHLAAMANQQQMVSFLVKNNHVPVDIRAGGTEVTPLLAVATQRCSWHSGTYRYSPHTCGHPDAARQPPPVGGPETCVSMLRMFKLLLELGADPAAVDVCGGDWLAAAASAGEHGLWDALTAEDSRVTINLHRVHAGRVLLRAAHYSSKSAGGEIGFFKRAADFLQRLYAAEGASEAFMLQLKESTTWVSVDRQTGKHSTSRSHALQIAVEGPRGGQVAEQLLDMGISLDALRLGRTEMAVGRVVFVKSVLAAVRHVVQRGESLLEHGRIVMALFMNCCTWRDSLEEVQPDFEALVHLMHEQGLDFREERWWPANLSSREREPHAPLPYLVTSPLTWAIFWKCEPGLLALLGLLAHLGDAEHINRIDPYGILAVVAAAEHSTVRVCKMLFEAGADVMGTDAEGRCAFWGALAREDRSDGDVIFVYLLTELNRVLSEDGRHLEVTEFLQRPVEDDLTLAQIAAMRQADDMLALLATMPLPINLTYTDKTPLRIICQRPSTANNIVVIRALVGRTNEALTHALTERSSDHGLTVLGHAVAWGHGSTVEILAAACKREGLDLAPLLERHVLRSRFHTPLFAAIAHLYPLVLEILFEDNDLQLTPQLSTEHLLLSPEAQLPGARPAGRQIVGKRGRPGQTESLSLLMCAASVGNVIAVRLLLKAGVDAREEPFPGNRWYKNALTAAIDFPDLPGFPGAEGSADGSSNNMGRNQLACVLELLKVRAAMTEEQVYRVLDAVYHASDTEVGLDLFTFMSKRLAQCHHCRMVGCWRKCGGCRSTFYCGADCQAADWAEHQAQCGPAKPKWNGKSTDDLSASAAELDLRT